MLKGTYFAVNVTPDVGTPLAYDIQTAIDDPLYLKGFIFLPEGKDPFVVAAIDWIGIACKGLDRLKGVIAEELCTKKENVAVHSVHYHDAPHCNESAMEILIGYGHKEIADKLYDKRLLDKLCNDIKPAIKDALLHEKSITHIGYGKGEVEGVASNRRIIGGNGKVLHTRYSSCKNPDVRAFPEGVIDRNLDLITLWSDEELVASLSYYATHPMSYYRMAMASSDFPGMATNMFATTVTKGPHLYFNGAGGNITAGKYNDGEKKNRYDLAFRLHEGMKKAWINTLIEPVTNVDFVSMGMALPIDQRFPRESCIELLKSPGSDESEIKRASRKLSWFEWTDQKPNIDVSAITLNKTKILHMPGELFIEYQLYAKEKHTDFNVCMAAYGEYGTSYIGTKKSYAEGGYETGPFVTKVSEESEKIIKTYIDRLIKGK